MPAGRREIFSLALFPETFWSTIFFPTALKMETLDTMASDFTEIKSPAGFGLIETINES